MEASFGTYFLTTSVHISVLIPPGAMALTVICLRPKSVHQTPPDQPLGKIHETYYSHVGRGLTNSKTSGKRLHGPFATRIDTMVRYSFCRSTDAAQYDLHRAWSQQWSFKPGISHNETSLRRKINYLLPKFSSDSGIYDNRNKPSD